jgi:hypothetical protein
MSIEFKKQLKQQLKQNLLAILSIAIAINALAYNSWRNELSEENRNYREAGFEIMREAAHLQYLIDTTTFAKDKQKADPIDGWVRVNLIVALSELMMPEIKAYAVELKTVWGDNWSSLTDGEQANERLTAANRRLVEKVRLHLLALH